MPLRISLLSLAAALTISWPGSATAQQITFRLPEDDPNTNSGVIRSAAFSPDGLLLAVGYGRFTGMLQEPRPGQAVIWEARSGKRKVAITGRVDGVCSVTFSPDGKILAVAEFPGIIRLWDVSSSRERLTIKARAWTPGTIAFSPDGKRLAAGLWTGAVNGVSPPGNDVLLWDAATGKPARTMKGHGDAVLAVAFSPDGRLLVSGGMDGTAKVWEITSGRTRATLKFPGLRRRLADPRLAQAEPLINVESVAFSPDGRTLVTSAGVPLALLGAADRKRAPEGLGEVTFWSTTNDQEVATLKGYEGTVRQVVFSPGGKLLATAGSDGLIRLWDTTTRRKVGEMKGGYPIAFSPDGRELVSSVDERTLAPQKVADAIHPGEVPRPEIPS